MKTSTIKHLRKDTDPKCRQTATREPITSLLSTRQRQIQKDRSIGNSKWPQAVRSGTTLLMLECCTKRILSVQWATCYPLDTLCTNTALDRTDNQSPHNTSRGSTALRQVEFFAFSKLPKKKINKFAFVPNTRLVNTLVIRQWFKLGLIWRISCTSKKMYSSFWIYDYLECEQNDESAIV